MKRLGLGTTFGPVSSASYRPRLHIVLGFVSGHRFSDAERFQP